MGLLGKFAAVCVAVAVLAGCGGPEPGSAEYLEEALARCRDAVPADFRGPVHFRPPVEDGSKQSGDDWLVGGYLDAEDAGVRHRYLFACRVDRELNVVQHRTVIDE